MSDTPVIRFRNYKPAAETNAGGSVVVPPTAAPSVLLKREQERKGAEEVAARSAADRAGSDAGAAKSEAQVDDIAVAIAPKKPNWDLKRDIQSKLEVLAARTQAAIVDMMLERSSGEASSGAAFAAAVMMSAGGGAEGNAGKGGDAAEISLEDM